jgi:hypothetical protein
MEKFNDKGDRLLKQIRWCDHAIRILGRALFLVMMVWITLVALLVTR